MHAPGSKLGPVGARVSSEPEVAAAGKEVRAVMVAEGWVDACTSCSSLLRLDLCSHLSPDTPQ